MVYPSESFDPAAAVQAVSKEKCAALYGVPTMFIAMLDEMKNHKDLDFSKERLLSLQEIIAASKSLKLSHSY